MRVLVVRPGADWSVADVATGWIWGLQQVGVEVVDFRWDQRLALHRATLVDRGDGPESAWSWPDAAVVAADGLLSTVYECQPDVVLVVSGWEIPPAVFQVMRNRGETVVLHHTESPYHDDRHVDMAWCADLHLVNDPLGVDRLRAAGARALYAPQSYRPDVHHPGAGHRDLSFVFVGSGFAARRAFFEQMEWPQNIDPVLAGDWRRLDPTGPDPLAGFVPDWLPQPLDNTATADLYRRAAMSLNLYRTDMVQRPELVEGTAMGPREVELAACGTFFLRDPRPESDEVLPMLPTFGSPEEASEKLAWWWARPGARHDAAQAARAAVADRTFDQLAKGLLGCLERVDA